MVASLRYSDVYAKLDRDRWTPLMRAVQDWFDATAIVQQDFYAAAAGTVADEARIKETPKPKGE